MTDFTGTYDVTGVTTAGPAIVFLHGTRLSRAAWASQVANLAPRHRVLTLDLPGHGSMMGVPFSLAAATDHLVRVIETVVGEPVVVVGLSLGGYVAMDLAAHRPDLVRGLVLSGATAEPVGLRSAPYLALAWVMERFGGARLDALSSAFFRARYGPSIAEPIIAAGFSSVGGATALRALAGQRFLPRLAAYPGPTLILNGAWDLPFRLGARRFADAAQRPRRVRLAGATHLADLDRPAAFSLAIERFVASLDGPA